MQQKTLVVLAAGMGSRYGGLKQMDPVGPGGAFILDYTVYDALRAGFGRVVCVIRRDMEALFRETVVARLEKHVEVVCVFQACDALPAGMVCPSDRVKPWGTGHAVLMAAGEVDGPFAVVTADDFYGRDSFVALAGFLDASAGSPGAYAMVGYRLRQTLSEHGAVSRGICGIDADGMLHSLVERTAISWRGGQVHCDEQNLTGDELCSMSLFGFQPDIFDHLARQFEVFLKTHGQDPKAEFFLPTVVNEALCAGAATMRVLPTESQWVGVTNLDDRPRVVATLESLVDAGVYPARLWV